MNPVSVCVQFFILNLFEAVFINHVRVCARTCKRARSCVCVCVGGGGGRRGGGGWEGSIDLCGCMDVVK